MNGKQKLVKGIAFVLLLAVVTWCGKKDDDEDSTEKEFSPSYYYSTKALLPACTSTRNGHLAYVKDEAVFLVCDGTAWGVVNITGPTGATGATGASGTSAYVYDANGTQLGVLALADWPAVGIQFSDSGVGMFTTRGIYANGLCAEGYCSTHVTASGGTVAFSTNYISSSGAGVTSPGYLYKSYVYYTAVSCGGTAYTMNKPLKNSIFAVPTTAGGFVVASGSESMTSGLTPLSAYVYDASSCSTLATGSGVCCSTSNSGTYFPGYGVTTTYSLPSGVTYPFTSPLYFKRQ